MLWVDSIQQTHNLVRISINFVLLSTERKSLPPPPDSRETAKNKLSLMMRYSDERMRRSCHKFTLILNFLLCLASFMFSKAKTLRLTIKVLKRFEDTRNELSMIKFHAFLCSLCFGMHRRAVWRKNLSTRKPQISFIPRKIFSHHLKSPQSGISISLAATVCKALARFLHIWKNQHALHFLHE